MSLAVLQINDLDLAIQTEGGQLYSECGYALLTDQGIETGDSAKAKRWLNPQGAFDQYWDQLNQTPLPVKHPHARHHADLAYAQLVSLLKSVDNPDQVILAVDGHITDQQLSLLLGLLKALNTGVVGVIDSAVVACVDHPKAQLIIEIQLYQTVITEVIRQQDRIDILKQQSIPDLGITQLHNLVASHISQQLIENYRYDPLHSSASEQHIYDLIPNWLQQLTQQPVINTQVDSPNGELGLIIKRETIAQLFLARMESLTASLINKSLDTVYFAEDARFITQLIPKFNACSVLKKSLLINRCFQLMDQFHEDELERTTAIIDLAVINSQSTASSTDTQTLATHLLYNNHAYPIHRPISIFSNEKKISIASKKDKKADAVISLHKGQLQVTHQRGNLQIRLPKGHHLGEILLIDDQSLLLIGVDDG